MWTYRQVPCDESQLSENFPRSSLCSKSLAGYIGHWTEDPWYYLRLWPKRNQMPHQHIANRLLHPALVKHRHLEEGPDAWQKPWMLFVVAQLSWESWNILSKNPATKSLRASWIHLAKQVARWRASHGHLKHTTQDSIHNSSGTSVDGFLTTASPYDPLSETGHTAALMPSPASTLAHCLAVIPPGLEGCWPQGWHMA